MARSFVFFVVVGGLGMFLFSTRPTQSDYLAKLQDRARIQHAEDGSGLYLIRSTSDPVDMMVAAHAPSDLLQNTRFDDYLILSVFTTEFDSDGYGVRRVRTVGFCSTLLSYRLD